GRGFETAESLAARGERGVPVEQILRDMRINRIFEGSTEIMHLMLAREAVDAHLSVAGDIIDPDTDLKDKARAAAQAGKFYARWLPTLVTGKGRLPTSFSEFGPLAEHLRYVERASRKLARSTFYAMSRWQGKLEYRQRFLGRIVDIGAELFAMTAACVRAGGAAGEAGHSEVELADAFCRQSRVRAEQLFTALWDNSDDADRKLAHGVLDGRYTWLEEGIIDPSIDGPWIAQEGGEVTDDVHRVIT
ncbi:acyl-CoA dehydrogenase family protein, partial [Mycolicibacterium fortuitum]